MLEFPYWGTNRERKTLTHALVRLVDAHTGYEMVTACNRKVNGWDYAVMRPDRLPADRVSREVCRACRGTVPLTAHLSCDTR